MAADTLSTPNFQAKDWEVLMSIIDNSTDADLKRVKFNLIAYYSANGNPSGNTVVPVQVKEKTLIKIFQSIYFSPMKTGFHDTGNTAGASANAFKRMIDIIRAKAAATLPGDNYLTNRLQQEDLAREAAHDSARKVGRGILMMDIYDNS